jgi:hypothetical protein
MGLVSVCAVLMAHHNLKTFNRTSLMPVPHVITSDNRLPGTIHVGSGTPDRRHNGEEAVGRHVHDALNTVFSRFSDCMVAAVIEDDLELSPDYFDVLKAAAPFVSEHMHCYTAMNNIGNPK